METKKCHGGQNTIFWKHHKSVESSGEVCWHSDSSHVIAITIKLCYCSNVSLLLYNLLPHVGIKSGCAFLFGSIPASWAAWNSQEMLLSKNITKVELQKFVCTHIFYKENRKKCNGDFL